MAEIIFRNPTLGPKDQCRVFMPSQPRGFNISDLYRYGLEVQPIMRLQAIFPDNASEFEAVQVVNVEKFLKIRRFRSDQDYIAIMGDPIITASVMFALGRMVDSVVLLRYDTLSRAYWPFRMSFNTGEKQ